jgi:hypothetical protein
MSGCEENMDVWQRGESCEMEGSDGSTAEWTEQIGGYGSGDGAELMVE